jgi:hypothetical protein
MVSLAGSTTAPAALSLRCASEMSTKAGYLMYLGNSDDVLLVPILSCFEDESMLLA